MIDKINQAHDAGWLPFTAEIDPTDNVYGGQGLVEAGATAVTRNGAGKALDQQSGLRIVNGGEEFNVDISSAKTVQDVLNAINANSGLLAEINDTKDGINLRTRDSGADFMVGENGGTTATQLGIRSFTAATQLSGLNYGRGVADSPADSATGGVDFTITRVDGTKLSIDIAGAETIGDVLNLINHNLNNADGKLTARLAVHGNGIELVDNSTGTGKLTVTCDPSSTAAIDLGLVPPGKSQSSSDTDTLTGADVNEIEARGVFTALLRLRQALQANDTDGIQRAVELLDESAQNLYKAQAKLGALEQRLDVMSGSLDTEDTQLRTVLSNEYDADITQVVSDLAARQTAYEASLKATGSIFQMTLFNYL